MVNPRLLSAHTRRGDYMANEVSDLINALRDGSMSLHDVAQQFRKRTWPLTKKPPPQDYLEMASRAEEDPEPDGPG